MARVTPEEYADDWASGLSGATAKIRRGIERVTVSPGVKAADAQDRFQAALLASIADGTWAAQLRKMTVDDWKASAINKGLTRIATGVTEAKPAQVETARKLLAAVDASVAEANRTPRGDLEANITRMNTFVRGMAKRKLRRPGA